MNDSKFGVPVLGGGEIVASEQVVGGEYKIVEEFGHGSFSQIWRATDALGRAIVVKFYLIQELGGNQQGDGGSPDLMTRELAVFNTIGPKNPLPEWDKMTGLWGPPEHCIISPIRVFSYMNFGPELSCGIYAGIAMPAYPISLNNYLRVNGRISPDFAAHGLACIFRALVLLHNSGFVHCDIKPGNLMLTRDRKDISGSGDFNLVLIDFNTTYAVERDGQWSTGTRDYMAPEVLFSEAPESGSDIWATAAVAYEMITTYVLFDIDNETVENSSDSAEAHGIDKWISFYKMADMYQQVAGPLPERYARILRKKGIFGPENTLTLAEEKSGEIDMDILINKKSRAKKMDVGARKTLSKLAVFIKTGLQYDVVARGKAQYWAEVFRA